MGIIERKHGAAELDEPSPFTKAHQTLAIGSDKIVLWNSKSAITLDKLLLASKGLTSLVIKFCPS